MPSALTSILRSQHSSREEGIVGRSQYGNKERATKNLHTCARTHFALRLEAWRPPGRSCSDGPVHQRWASARVGRGGTKALVPAVPEGEMGSGASTRALMRDL
jgi:hypothetical protein